MFDGKFQYLKTIHISFLARKFKYFKTLRFSFLARKFKYLNTIKFYTRKFILFENNEKSYFWRENSIILLLTGGPVFGQNEIQ